jgi:hypothetical protein
MGGTCGTHGRDTKCVQNVWSEKLHHSEDLDVDRSITLEWILRI